MRIKSAVAAVALLILLQQALAVNTTYYTQEVDRDHPLFSSSFAEGQANLTTYHFRLYNPLDTPTTAFRLALSSNFTWFLPADLHYMLAPDGVDGNSPYWNLPPLLQNESTEVSFSVDRVVSLPESIAADATPIDAWNGTCTNLVPYGSQENGTALVKEFLAGTNRTQDVTGYYAKDGLLLAHLEGYGTFAVFNVTGLSAVPVSSPDAVSALVRSYADTVTQPSGANLSKLHEALMNAKLLKYRPEHECYMLTGMDDSPCVDRDSCIYACFSVPVCSMVGQSGWSFLDLLQDYNRSVHETNFLLDKALASGKAAEAAPSYWTVKDALDGLSALNRAETKVIFHPLMTSYGFCEPPEYAVPAQTDARRELLDYLADACVQGKIGSISADALHAASLLGPPPGRNTSRSAGNASAANVTGATNPAARMANASNVTGVQRNMTNATGAQPQTATTSDRTNLVLGIAFVMLFGAGFVIGRTAAKRLR